MFLVAPAGSRVKMKSRIDKHPYLGAVGSIHNSQWENVTSDGDRMGESREFVMPTNRGGKVSFVGQYDERVAPDDPNPEATYVVSFIDSTGARIGSGRVVVPKGMGPVSREYTFTAR